MTISVGHGKGKASQLQTSPSSHVFCFTGYKLRKTDPESSNYLRYRRGNVFPDCDCFCPPFWKRYAADNLSRTRNVHDFWRRVEETVSESSLYQRLSQHCEECMESLWIIESCNLRRSQGFETSANNKVCNTCRSSSLPQECENFFLNKIETHVAKTHLCDGVFIVFIGKFYFGRCFRPKQY